MMMTQSPYDTSLFAPARQTNTLGVAGFVCALLGLLTGGHLLSPIGLILSLVALGRRPRGFAVAGVIIGFLGTCGWLIVLLLVVLALAGAAVALTGVFFFSQAERIETTTDMSKIAMLAEDYKHENRGIPPADLSVLNLQTPTLTDPWGHHYRWELIDAEPGYDVISDGPDGKPDTTDDIRLSKLDKYWEGAGEDFKRQLEEFDKQHKAQTNRPGHRMSVSTSRSATRPQTDDAATQPELGHEP